MSIADVTTGHECVNGDAQTPPGAVVVDGTRIPVLNDGIRTEVRKNEAVAITRHSEVRFPIEWNGIDYGTEVRALDPTAENVYDVADIYVRDEVRDTLVLVHRGFVMGVGGAGTGRIEQRMTIGDVGQLLGAIPFDESYEPGVDARSVAADITDRLAAAVTPNVFSDINFTSALRTDDEGNVKPATELSDEARSLIAQANEELDISDERPVDEVIEAIGDVDVPGEVFGPSIPVGVGGEFELGEVGGAVSRFARVTLAPSTYLLTDGFDRLNAFITNTAKTFQPNEDTLADALSWIEGQTDGVFYFEPTPNTADEVSLVYDEVLAEKGLNATHLSDDGQIEIVRNNALHEIRPNNTLIAAGKRDNNGAYPLITVVHEPLVARAAEPLSGPLETMDVVKPTDLARKAKRELRRQLSAAALGQIVTAPCPAADPYTVVNSLPACGAQTASGPPLDYEVESVVHHVSARRPDDPNRHRAHETQLRVAVPARLSNIAVANLEVRNIESPNEDSLIEKAREIGQDITAPGVDFFGVQ